MGGARPRLLTRSPSIRGALPRPRLLDVARGAAVIAVCAPGGSGTSTLAAQIAESHAGRVAWCRLAPGFDTFGDVIEMATTTVDGGEIDAAARRSIIDAADRFLDLFEAGPLTLVIDDHHLAADGDIDRLIAELAALLPADGRIIVAGATRPAALIGLVPAPTLALIDADDLAFQDDEAIELFAAHGGDAGRAREWCRQLGGWAQGISAGAHAPDAEPADIVRVLLDQLSAHDSRLLDAVALLPYLNEQLAVASCGLPAESAAAQLRDLADSSPLIADLGDAVRLHEAAAQLHRPHVDTGDAQRIGQSAGSLLATTDPTTAIDIFLEAGDAESAADVLADHISDIGVDRALTWLYRFPPELRRRFPPVLAAGQATVEVDTALATAQARVETADNERSRREALFALGSIEQHRGELGASATAFEAALRSAHDDDEATARISIELAGSRWLLGDAIGARAALERAADAPSTRWLTTQLDIAEGLATRPTGVHLTADDDAFDLASMGVRALSSGDLDAASEYARAAYASAVDSGGEPLLAAGVVRAWVALREGDTEVALSTADEFERRLGPRHELGRLHGAIIRERVSREREDRGQHERDQRRLRDLRRRGYASLEQLAELILDPAPSSSLEPASAMLVRVLGQHIAEAGERTIRRSDWKSKKAFEVLTVLAFHGSRGARREQVIEAVWPGRPPDKGRTLLRTALSEIRRVVEPDRPTGEPSKFVTTSEDNIALDGELDIDRAERSVVDDPIAAFTILADDLAPEVVASEWAGEWPARIERLRIAAAIAVPADAEVTVRIRSLEALINAEPWQRSHYDSLADVHRSDGDEGAAAEVERRWFADE